MWLHFDYCLTIYFSLNSILSSALSQGEKLRKHNTFVLVCGQQSDETDPAISCSKDNLRIRWPTNLTFGAAVVKIPDSVLSKLEDRIRSKGLALDIVVISRNPP